MGWRWSIRLEPQSAGAGSGVCLGCVWSLCRVCPESVRGIIWLITFPPRPYLLSPSLTSRRITYYLLFKYSRGAGGDVDDRTPVDANAGARVRLPLPAECRSTTPSSMKNDKSSATLTSRCVAVSLKISRAPWIQERTCSPSARVRVSPHFSITGHPAKLYRLRIKMRWALPRSLCRRVPETQA